MKKTLILLLVAMFAASFTFAGVSCAADDMEEEASKTTETMEEEESTEEEMEAQEEEAAPSDEEVTIVFQNWLTGIPIFADMFTEMVEMFEDENPNVTVEFETIPFKETFQQTTIRVAGGNPPDIALLTPKWAMQFGHMGALEDLYPYFSEEELNDVVPIQLEAGILGEELVSFQWQMGTITLLSNKALLEQAGLPVEAPDTWEEWITAVEKISELDDDIYGFGARTIKDTNSAFWMFPVIWEYGGQFEDDEGNIVLDTPEVLDALNFYKRMGEEGLSPIGLDTQEVRTLFSLNKCAFIFDGPWMKNTIRDLSGEGEDADDNYIVSQMPIGLDGERHAHGNNHSLAVFKQSEVKEEAIELLRFLTGDEEATKFYYQEGASIPAYQSLLEDPIYDDPYAQAFIETSYYAVNVPSQNQNFMPSLDYVAEAMQKALLGGDTEQIQQELHNAIKTLYGQ